jgi:preprotein translocase subunit Sss1
MKINFRSPSFSSWFNTGVKMLILLSLTPLLLSRFESKYITIWYLVSSVTGLTQFLDFGFTTTLLRYSSYHHSGTLEKKTYLQYLRVSNVLFFFVGLIGFVICLVILHMSFTGNGELGVEKDDFNGIIIIPSIYVFLSIQFKRIDPVLKGFGHIVKVYWVNGCAYLLVGILLITYLFLFSPTFSNFMAVYYALMIIYVLKDYILSRYLVSSEYSGFKVEMNYKAIMEIWKPTWRAGLISLSSVGLNRVISIIIANRTSVDISSSYLLTSRLIGIINEFSWAPFYTRLPNFISDYKNMEVDRSNLLKRMKFRQMNVIALLLVGILILGFLGNFTLELIESNTKFLSTYLIISFGLVSIIERLNSMNSQAIMMSNNVSHYSVYCLYSIIIAVVIYFLLKNDISFIPYVMLPSALLVGIHLNKLAKKTILYEK